MFNLVDPRPSPDVIPLIEEISTVHATVSARHHSVLGEDAAQADRDAGPTVEHGLEVVPRRSATRRQGAGLR